MLIERSGVTYESTGEIRKPTQGDLFLNPSHPEEKVREYGEHISLHRVYGFERVILRKVEQMYTITLTESELKTAKKNLMIGSFNYKVIERAVEV